MAALKKEKPAKNKTSVPKMRGIFLLSKKLTAGSKAKEIMMPIKRTPKAP